MLLRCFWAFSVKFLVSLVTANSCRDMETGIPKYGLTSTYRSNIWLSDEFMSNSPLLTSHFHSFLFFSSSYQFISSAALHLFSMAPFLPVCGKSHQWASGADVQVSGGDQQSYQGETGPGAEGGQTGGAQRQPSPGRQPSGRVSRLRPEPDCVCRPDAQWSADCTRRETWWMNSSSPPSPSFLLFFSSPFLTSPHTTWYLEISTESN